MATGVIEKDMEIDHISQALFVLPRKVLDLRFPISDVTKLRSGPKTLVMMRVMNMTFYDRRKKKLELNYSGKLNGRAVRVYLNFQDRNGKTIDGTSFSPFEWLKIEKETVVPMMADIEYFNNRLQIQNPEVIPRKYIGGINPIYPALRSKASAERVFDATRTALTMLNDSADYLLANAGMRERDIIEITGMSTVDMLKEIHSPKSPASWEVAMEAAKKLAVQEVLLKAERIKNRNPDKRSMLLTMPLKVEGITLTQDQQQAIAEITADLRSGFPMRRLLSGDVGRGKTIPMVVAVASVWLAAKQANKSVNIAMMLPNEGLVDQVIGQFQRFFPEVLCSPITGRKKKFEEGSVVIGTSAVSFLKNYVADFLLIDEQHKFSREQREAISAPYTNILEATATAIPRSIALITHGGMEVSILRQSPVVKNIRTHLISNEERVTIYNTVDQAIKTGKRVLLVYPMVEESEAIDATTVEQGYNAWKSVYGNKVGMVHGQMPAEDKKAAIQKMRDNEYQILAASSVVEVGLDIPDISAMVVAFPQRYGLNQLHQLRGRLARNGGDADMFLYPDEEISEEALQRLLALVETNDGFEIAERDMQLRGFGDMGSDSDEQSGASEVTFRGLTLMPSDFKMMNVEAPANTNTRLKM